MAEDDKDDEQLRDSVDEDEYENQNNDNEEQK